MGDAGAGMPEIQDGGFVEGVCPVLRGGPVGESAYGLLLGLVQAGLARDRQGIGHAPHANADPLIGSGGARMNPMDPAAPSMLPECVTRSTRPT